MSSSMNRQSNPLTTQGNNNLTAVQLQPTHPASHAQSSGRGKSAGDSTRKIFRSRRGPRVSTDQNTTLTESQQRYRNPLPAHRRGGRRGEGSLKDLSVGRSNFHQAENSSDQTKRDPVHLPAESSGAAVSSDFLQPDDDQNTDAIKDKSQIEVPNDSHPNCLDKNSSLEGVSVSGGPASDNPVEANSSTKNQSRTHKTMRINGCKYKQRREARQLIDGLDGFDIDLFESLAPISADASARSRHSTRKINLSHLVNYNYHREQRGGIRTHRDPSGPIDKHYNQQGHHNRYHHSNEHKFSKQQFLQANCQFVVLDGYDYTIHKVNPDWPVEWDCIEEVKFRQTGATETNCPICLETPVAAKITRCGHIYCWPCMLRYLSMCDDNNVPCPICFEPIYQSDLRSVVSQTFQNHVVGEEILMRLMFRRKGCVEVEQYNGISEYQVKKLEDTPHYRSQANLIVVNPTTVIQHIAQRELDELQFKMDLEKCENAGEFAEQDYTGMVCFIEQAIEAVSRRIDQLKRLANDKERSLKQHKKLQASHYKGESDPNARSYLFYQSIDGQHVYLNPFSTKVMCHEYGSLEGCPLEIHAKVLQMSWISMNDAWRKRFKYLEHLPLSCEFRLVEVDFQESSLVSRKTYDAFREQINLRAKERSRRQREEANRDRQIQVEQNRKIYGIQPSLEINLDNPEQFPSVLNERYLDFENQGSEEERDGPSVERDDNDENVIDNVGRVTLSFADIQLQEAAQAEKAMKQKKQNQGADKNTWTASVSGSKGQKVPQSSFAQLLVDAKTSQQKWTRSAGSTSRSIQMSNTSQQPGPQSTKSTNNISDDDGEELRAPPCEFSMSDYLSANVLSGKRRSKKKKG